MADRRLLAGSITESGQVASLITRCGPWAGLFFTWCIPFVDDDGRLTGDPDTLRHKVMGRYLGRVSQDDVEGFLRVMDEIGLVVWYAVVGSPAERYLYVPKFSLHQTLRSDRYGQSRFPPPPRWVPEEGHPYHKTPGLDRQKPQRDTRKTVRVATLATAPQPLGNQSAPAWQPPDNQSATAPRTSGRKPAAEDSARLPSAPLLAPPRGTADAAAAAAGDAGDDGLDACVGRIYHELVDTARQARDGSVIAGDGSTHQSQNALVLWANDEARRRAVDALSEPGIGT